MYIIWIFCLETRRDISKCIRKESDSDYGMYSFQELSRNSEKQQRNDDVDGLRATMNEKNKTGMFKRRYYRWEVIFIYIYDYSYGDVIICNKIIYTMYM